VQGGADQGDRCAHDVPVHSAGRIAGDLGLLGGRSGGHEAAGDAPDDGDEQDRGGGQLGMIAAVGALKDEQPPSIVPPRMPI
jgi:hypothetical protein